MWAPDTASYGYDSRAASVRILSGPGVKGYATRFEVRVPGADVSMIWPGAVIRSFSSKCARHACLQFGLISVICR